LREVWVMSANVFIAKKMPLTRFYLPRPIDLYL